MPSEKCTTPRCDGTWPCTARTRRACLVGHAVDQDAVGAYVEHGGEDPVERYPDEEPYVDA